jgi:glycosyltransferase involved in cell wall biosynthesis
MKIALVHDYIKEYGGAERVLETLHEIYPDAPVYTSAYLPSFLGPHQARFKDWDIRPSWAQHLPFKAKLISPLRLISPLLFRSFNFSGYDVIITSATGAYFPNSLKKKQAKLLCYCHTPPRYLYGYATARNWRKHKLFQIMGSIANHFLRMADYAASKNVDQYIANSYEVAQRIAKFYRREATVIYPPVQTKVESQKSKDQKRQYYLTGGRLARAKHVDVIVNACAALGVPLKVFGKGFAGYEDELRAMSYEVRDKVEFVGEVTDEEKLALMAGAKAFLFASEDEDFGIVPVEAMAQGTPVIAYRSGGVQETVIDKKTGLFFDELTPESLQKAIELFEKLKIKPEACQKQAKKFSKEIFQKNINDVVLREVLHGNA